MTEKSTLRIYHGPINICGQATFLANSQRDQGCLSDCIVFNENKTGYNPAGHLSLELDQYGVFSRLFLLLSFFVLCLFRYNIFHFYFGRSILPLNLDLPVLKLFGKKVIMTYCGSDIRLMSVDKQRNPYWEKCQFDGNHEKYDGRKMKRMKWHRLWVDKVIAPRNLYGYASKVFSPEEIEATIFVHNQVDISEYCPVSYETNQVPLIVHAPSNMNIKGTAYFERAIDELRAEGYQFEYLVLNEVPYQEVHKILQDRADIVADQFLLGGFGSFAVEGMYYGKPVVVYVLDEIIEEHCQDIPIVNATIENLKDKLKDLILAPELREKLGREGRKYVENNFDKNIISLKMFNLYKELSAK